MIYRTTHATIYNYTETVSFCQNIAHLKPRQTDTQLVRESVLTVEPAPSMQEDLLDFYRNHVTIFAVHEPHRRLRVEVSSTIENQNPSYTEESLPWQIVESFVRTDLSPSSLEAVEYLYPSPHVPLGRRYREYGNSCFPANRNLLACVKALNETINRDFRYVPLSTTVSTPISEVMEKRKGVCQDFAHLMIACLRSRGLPARYVSGCLRTHPPEGKPRLVGADATHAWVSVYSPGQGWIDFDPTNNSLVGEDHITTAWGRDYSDVSPIRGILQGGAGQTLQVSVDVAPLVPAPGPTTPP